MTLRRELSIDSVSHRYGNVEAVSNVSLTVQSGQVHCLLGASGSGKSTLLRVIAGLERQQAGSVAIDGEVVSDSKHHQPAERRAVGFVFQDYALFPHLNALRNVLFGMKDRRSHGSQEKAKQLLADAGLARHVTSMPHMLSGGEQQRVALARAMAQTPSVMLLDEPFSGLDVQLRSGVREATLQLLKNADIATILVTHDPAEAMYCGDQISVMRNGSIVQTDFPDVVYQNPVDIDVAKTFGRINDIPPTVRIAGLSQDDAPVLIRPERLTLVENATVDDASSFQIRRVVPEGATSLYVVENAVGDEFYVRCLSTRPIDSAIRYSLQLID